MNLAEKLRLVDPHVPLRAPAEHVDVITQRRVALVVQRAHEPRRELLVRVGAPFDLLVEIDEVALVDPRVRGIDDHEHLGRELRRLAVEDHARNFDAPVGVGLAQVEVQPGEPMLAVDDQERRARQRKVAHLLVLADRAELRAPRT